MKKERIRYKICSRNTSFLRTSQTQTCLETLYWLFHSWGSSPEQPLNESPHRVQVSEKCPLAAQVNSHNYGNLWVISTVTSPRTHSPCYHLLGSSYIHLWILLQCVLYLLVFQFSSVQLLSCVRLESQHARPPCPSPTPGVHPNPCPSSRWCHPAISSSVVPFSSCPQSLPASGSFPMSQLFTWGDQSIGVSASTSDLPMNTQDWSPFRWTGWIFLQLFCLVCINLSFPLLECNPPKGGSFFVHSVKHSKYSIPGVTDLQGMDQYQSVAC